MESGLPARLANTEIDCALIAAGSRRRTGRVQARVFKVRPGNPRLACYRGFGVLFGLDCDWLPE